VTVDRGSTLSDEQIDQAALGARRELLRRARVYRRGRPLPDLGGRTVVLVDDGILSGRTMRAALATLGRFRPRRIIAAAPVAATMAAHHLRGEADELVTVATAGDLRAVADVYDDFHPLADAEVLGELARGRAAVQADAEIVVAEVDVDVGGTSLAGTLSLPRDARAVVIVCAGVGRRTAARTAAFELLGFAIGSLVIDSAPSSAAYVAGVDRIRRWPAAAGLALGLLGDDASAVNAAAAARPGVVFADAVADLEAAL
jgi:putative phosphoribosyl transferase